MSPSAASRWLARASLAAYAAAVVLFLTAAGTGSLRLFALVASQVVLVVIGIWVAVAHHGALRIAGLLLALAALVVGLVAEARHGQLWVVLATLGLLALAVAAGQRALRPTEVNRRTGTGANPPHRPFLIMNPRSGGGKVERFELRQRAEKQGAQVALLDGPGTVDVVAIARQAVADGADLLGVAGGDGTQALVAGVCAASGLPLLVIPAGTRNHFALDLGLDRDDPSLSLDALTDGVDVAVDLGEVAGRPFVNNVSFGAYATIVARPDYRDDKTRVTLDVLPDMLTGHQGPHLTVHADGVVADNPQAALVSNNPYGNGDVAGLGRRARIDSGRLGLLILTVSNALQAARLLRGRNAPGLQVLTADEVVVESDSGQVAAGIDGESVMLPSPVQCRIRPGALTVRVPRNRPGVPSAHEPYSVRRMWSLARATGR